MAANFMRYRFEGELYELAVCFGPDKIKQLTAGHTDGVIDVERMMKDPNPENGSTPRMREWTVRELEKLRDKRDARERGETPAVPTPQTLSRIVEES